MINHSENDDENSKCEECLSSIMMFILINQHLSNI